MSPEEFTPPKYAQIVQAIKRKIDDGTYPPGALLPSETQLVREFNVSRPTVVRALQVLQLRGVIEREHGKGSYVKAAPPVPEEGSRPSRAVLDRVETDERGTVIEAGERAAPAVIADLLGIPAASAVMMRRVLFSDGERPSDLVTLWSPLDVAEGTDLGRNEPLTVGVRHHVQTVKGLRLANVVERLGARHPETDEAKLLGLGKSAPVISVMANVFDSSARPVVVVDLVMPGDLHELEDAYAL
ncbi:GntR family transcriptional regulator [Planomonospora venezuelensis]|uniref:DNA-binding GntR family transcriptional regulator n=1 Tax=Planomonospora venezuelensis TaxID=1999 RepID=A0A841CUA8_PLAVE|nr:GntR family transcriptional regulator [Planomonospora venezuelensis]MBB5960920.1 DNA-binding GntR family transcriptional regulator [Planomonospora venezuelensis]GIN01156.1 transcriptional regulator [Planomonospora venezuelensis]